MDEPVTVWIVEDLEDDARYAFDVVKNVTTAFQTEATVYWSDNFAWDRVPRLRPAIDRNLPDDAQSDYPDVVILDLCLRTSKGEELRGDTFYQKLRDFETHKPQGRPAFVIFWSLHRGKHDQFVESAVKYDARVIPLNSKQPDLLKQKLSNLWHRVLDEREECSR